MRGQCANAWNGRKQCIRARTQILNLFCCQNVLLFIVVSQDLPCKGTRRGVAPIRSFPPVVTNVGCLRIGTSVISLNVTAFDIISRPHKLHCFRWTVRHLEFVVMLKLPIRHEKPEMFGKVKGTGTYSIADHYLLGHHEGNPIHRIQALPRRLAGNPSFLCNIRNMLRYRIRGFLLTR